MDISVSNVTLHQKMKSPPKTSREFAFFVKEHSRIINKVCWAYATPKVPFEDLRQEIEILLQKQSTPTLCKGVLLPLEIFTC